ncbi:MAG: hypothetical protein JSW27_04265 [Phycisphaerales bacterium]|nr:MAG: hypothetical protein JSW27_04265 [Phycisphaerales bacterium]
MRICESYNHCADSVQSQMDEVDLEEVDLSHRGLQTLNSPLQLRPWYMKSVRINRQLN